jgi:hypothetical protein
MGTHLPMSTISWTKCWKKIRGVKILVAADKCGIPPAIDVSSANRHDTKGIVPVLRTLAEVGFKGAAPCKAGNGVCNGHTRAR